MKTRCLILTLTLGLACTTHAYDWSTYDVDDYEEDAGAAAAFEFNPADDIYGVTVSDGTWLTGAPILGDFFMTTFYNGIEDAGYAGAGLTLRLQPRWSVAPFAGGGGSYNLSYGGNDDDDLDTDDDEPEQGESYWAGHAEAGLRIRMEDDRYIELMGRYTWSSSDIEDPDYWLVRIGYGFGRW
jgi:hypothetical protein